MHSLCYKCLRYINYKLIKLRFLHYIYIDQLRDGVINGTVDVISILGYLPLEGLLALFTT